MRSGPERGVLAIDTSADVESRQINLWREMSTVERLALVNAAARAARILALSGLRERHPNASERELTARLARITFGDRLARQAYPELDQLTP